MGRRLCLLLFALIRVSAASPAERVVDLAADGAKLKATYFPAAQPGPGILLLHQCNRQRKVWDGLARQLAAAGIHVLTFDLRGFGESGGQPFDKLTPEQNAQIETEKRPGDIDTALQYLVSQPGVTRDRVGVGGASCGVGFSIETARRHPEVKALALLSGNAGFQSRRFLRNSPKLPVFFSVAADDEFPASVQAIDWLYALTADPEKKFVRYATGGHGADMFPVHPELPGMIVDWYVTTLIKTPGRAPVSKEAPAIPQALRILEMVDRPGGAAEVERMLNSKEALFPEALVNDIGYEHLQGGDTRVALEILKLNAAAYPNSPNAYDSLADVFLAAGQKDLAGENCKRALELFPNRN